MIRSRPVVCLPAAAAAGARNGPSRPAEAPHLPVFPGLRAAGDARELPKPTEPVWPSVAPRLVTGSSAAVTRVVTGGRGEARRGSGWPADCLAGRRRAATTASETNRDGGVYRYRGRDRDMDRKRDRCKGRDMGRKRDRYRGRDMDREREMDTETGIRTGKLQEHI